MTRNYLAVCIALALCIASVAVLNAADNQSPTLIKAEYPRLTSGTLASARLADMPTGVILRSKEVTITQDDLNSEIAKSQEALRPQLAHNQFYVLENKAAQTFLNYEAKNWIKQINASATGNQTDPGKAYLANLTKKISVTDEEVKAFYQNNKDLCGGATFEQSKDQLKSYVLEQKRQDAIQKYLASTSERYSIEIDKKWAAKQYKDEMNNPVDIARQSGRPTMVDFGADGCQPCEMLKPILASLTTEYEGKANILFVHVRNEQVLAARYGINLIPVQVFFDKDGNEVFRHLGFWPKDQIVAKLAETGVK